MGRRRYVYALMAVVAVGVVVWSSGAWAGVMPPGSTVAGKTLAEWSAEWWKWNWSLPENPATSTYEHPANDTDGSQAFLGNVGNMFYLIGANRLVTDPASPAPVVRVRNATVPYGLPIFLPVINAGSSAGNPARKQTLPELIVAVHGNFNLITDYHARIDGVVVTDIADRAEMTEGGFFATFPLNNVYSVPADRQNLPWISYAEGYYIMLEPLSPGQHEINFGGRFGPATAPIFELDITYNVTVTPEPGMAGLIGIVGVVAGLRRRR
ncbi:MAG: PEP-CTERM sorting domain-containing protein [Planctomycetota bacterium]|nr:PEP-CTERM sorting domain-containing protein [Planctomycetota bacterium]